MHDAKCKTFMLGPQFATIIFGDDPCKMPSLRSCSFGTHFSQMARKACRKTGLTGPKAITPKSDEPAS